MIPIASLTPADVGCWVIYSALPSHPERGRIKNWNDRFIYVVYWGAEHWQDFEQYTAAPTLPQHLDFE
jgi:hypothetical protein